MTRGILVRGDTLPYAFGIGHQSYRGLRTLEHGGSLTGFRTHLLRFPALRFSAIVLCNTPTAPAAQLARRIAEVFLADRMTAAPVATGPGGPPPQQNPRAQVMTATDGAEYVGTYRSGELDATWTFAVEGDQLVLRNNVNRNIIRRSAADVLSAGNLTLRFTRDASGRITGFSLDAGRVRGIRFERLPS